MFDFSLILSWIWGTITRRSVGFTISRRERRAIAKKSISRAREKENHPCLTMLTPCLHFTTSQEERKEALTYPRGVPFMKARLFVLVHHGKRSKAECWSVHIHSLPSSVKTGSVRFEQDRSSIDHKWLLSLFHFAYSLFKRNIRKTRGSLGYIKDDFTHLHLKEVWMSVSEASLYESLFLFL